jgi:hypothetical protein
MNHITAEGYMLTRGDSYLLPCVSTFWVCKEKYLLVYLCFQIDTRGFLMLMHPMTCLWFQLNNVFSLAFLCSLSRWQLPNEQPNYLASTANERRRDRAPPPLDPENLKAVIAGYSQSIFSCLKILSSSVLEYLLSSFFYCNSWEGIHYCNFYGVWRSNSCAVVHSR